MKFLTHMTYRFDFLFSFLSHIVLLLASVYLWKAAFQSESRLGEYTIDQMVTYSIISILVSIGFQTSVQDLILRKVRTGTVSSNLVYPVHFLGIHLAEDIGQLLTSAINRMLPIFLIAALSFEMVYPNIQNLGLFIASCALGFLIIWLIRWETINWKKRFIGPLG